jgi:hypothetical protein
MLRFDQRRYRTYVDIRMGADDFRVGYYVIGTDINYLTDSYYDGGVSQ